LIDRLSESIRLPSARLNQLWFKEVTDSQGNHLGGASEPTPLSTQPRRAQKPRDGGGNKGLVTRAVKHLVHFPAIAGSVSNAQLSQLEMNDDAGSRFLFELVDQLKHEPAVNSAVLLERWRERPEVTRMQALAGEENAIDEPGAALELVAAIESLAMEPRLRRHDELIGKDDLNDDERTELKELTAAIHRAKTRAG